jgi:aminoglycoside phosphotransferase family enzyme/predicted kinase
VDADQTTRPEQPSAVRTPWQTGAEPWVELRSTHSGAVLLLGDLAYKLKLPVRLGFLDFTERAARVEACRRELALNRRLAADVYLGVGELGGADTEPEPVVVMRRLPDDRRLRTMALRGEDLEEHVERLARVLAGFHSSARRGPDIDAEGTRDAIRARWEASFEQVHATEHPGIDDRVLAEIERLTRSFLDGREALFAERVRSGRIVDGHGDLLAEDIFCLDDGPRILDCLDFDARLRSLDQLDDVCCLAMDLELLGAPEAAGLLLDRYVEHSADPAPAALRHHFIAYRAFVRAKVGCLRGAADAVADVAAHAGLCLDHLRAGAVRLVLVGGQPGTGKTTVAAGLADRCGFVTINSDRVRKELAGLDPAMPAPAPFGTGLYDPESTRRTYAELLRRAGLLLARGESVVLDATWAEPGQRAAATALHERLGAEPVLLHCVLPVPVAQERVAGRYGPSDADAEVVARGAGRFTPWPDAVGIDTRAGPEACVEKAVTAVTHARPG